MEPVGRSLVECSGRVVTIGVVEPWLCLCSVSWTSVSCAERDEAAVVVQLKGTLWRWGAAVVVAAAVVAEVGRSNG